MTSADAPVCEIPEELSRNRIAQHGSAAARARSEMVACGEVDHDDSSIGNTACDRGWRERPRGLGRGVFLTLHATSSTSHRSVDNTACECGSGAVVHSSSGGSTRSRADVLVPLKSNGSCTVGGLNAKVALSLMSTFLKEEGSWLASDMVVMRCSRDEKRRR